MASSEQLKAWMGEIREGKNTVVFPGLSKQFEITPAEKIRYEANAKFGAFVVKDLIWLVEREEQITEEEISSWYSKHVPLFQTDEQRVKLGRITSHLIQLIRETKKIGKNELLHRIQQYADVIDGGLGSFRLSDVPSEDIDVTSYGAVILTIRDRHMWEDELGFSPDCLGKKISARSMDGVTARQKDAMNRLVFLRDEGKEMKENTRTHELFHDLYRRVFEQEMNIRYTTNSQRHTFSGLRNELVAYLISAEWQSKLTELLNRRDVQYDHELRMTLKKEVQKELRERSIPQTVAMKEAEDFSRMILRVQSEITRLGLKQAKATPELIGALLVSEDVKECVYHLATFEPEPLDADVLVPRNTDGTLLLREARKFGYLVTNHELPVLHFSHFVTSVEFSLEQAKKQTDIAQSEIGRWHDLLSQLHKYRKGVAVT